MTEPLTSSPITAARDITAGVINTGVIEQHTHLHLHDLQQALEHLATILAAPNAALRPAPDGGLEACAEAHALLRLPANVLDGLRLLGRASDLAPEQRYRAYAAWLVTRRPLVPPQVLAAREHYVPLAGWMSGQDLPLLTLHFAERRWRGEGPQRQLERIPLDDVTEAVQQHPALVLLGPPGCGKSTVLQRLALEAARALLTSQARRVPLRVNLATYGWPQHEPLAFLRQHWTQAGLPGELSAAIQAGEVLLLADGVNEMARLASDGERRQRANAWQEMLQTLFADPAPTASRAVLASRDQADYDQPLDLPRVDIEPLREAQMTAFLEARLGSQAAGALAAMQRLGLLEQARNPYELAVLAALYDPERGDLPPNRGRLFADYAVALLQREAHANHAHWIRLEAQLAALAHLGYAMQAYSESTVLPRERALYLVPSTVRLGQTVVPTPPEAVCDLACRAGLLVLEPGAQPAYRFSHQLLQEQCAARQLLQQWQADATAVTAHWRSPRTLRDMPAAQGGAWEALPPPPPTGWEQSTLLAAGMSDTPDAFVRAVLQVNPALAGRCVSEGAAPVQPETRLAVQQALLADLGNAALHRRTRLQAGRVLGAVGDPRLAPQQVGSVSVILPDLVRVPGGLATLGSARWPWDRQADADERPRHRVPVAEMYLGRWPVTNAEYRCFMQVGGYDVERYWTPEGWQWRQGQGGHSGPVEELLEFWRFYQREPRRIEQDFKAGRLLPKNAETWRALVRLPEDEVRQRFLEAYPVVAHTQPRYLNDPAYNASNQPVVGVTWYEAMAYCAWLHELATAEAPLWHAGEASIPTLLRSGQWQVRLPTEAEWEWAAGGPQHSRYPWGQTFAIENANTLEGRVLGTASVGAYPGGAAVCGALDLCGHVWEWTHSLYRSYPYSRIDGREQPRTAGRRTLRGGAWSSDARHARVSYRSHNAPADFNDSAGLRVVVAPAL
jgi:formylglycine-generating enzyme required for sulfatase activity